MDQCTSSVRDSCDPLKVIKLVKDVSKESLLDNKRQLSKTSAEKLDKVEKPIFSLVYIIDEAPV